MSTYETLSLLILSGGLLIKLLQYISTKNAMGVHEVLTLLLLCGGFLIELLKFLQ